MRSRLLALTLVLLALPTFGAVQYEFIQKNTVDDPVAPTSDMTARATVDGNRSRTDILGGTLYPPGTYVITNDESQRLFFIDPSKRSYTEFNAGGVTTALGASNIRIVNLKSNLVTHDERPLMLGLETEHSTLTLSYDITVTRGAIPVTSHVETEIETWSTSKYADALQSSAMNIARTGKPEIDRLIEEEARLKGFPLRQRVTTRAMFNLPANRSELKVANTKTMTRETRVTAIREMNAEASLFTIPPDYRRADTPDVPMSSTQVLTFDPPSK